MKTYSYTIELGSSEPKILLTMAIEADGITEARAALDQWLEANHPETETFVTLANGHVSLPAGAPAKL